MSFRNYKAKLRRGATMRKHGAHGLIPCPNCGGDIQHRSENCRTCGGMGQRIDNIGLSGRPQYEHEPCPACHGSGSGQGWYQCAGCDKTWDDDPAAIKEIMPGGIPCPKCGSDMYEQHYSPMFKDGAWECSNQGCWHMMPLTDAFPDAPPEDWKMSGSRQAARLSGMDDPQPDPQFDQERAQMPEQHAQDQQNIVDSIKSIEPQMRQFMRTRGINEPDWAPLEAVIPPSHLGDWMWMGYGKNGQREYKHWATRRYLNLLPQEELPPGYEGPGMDHLLKRQHIPFLNFHTRDGREVHQPVDMNYALEHAYDGVDQLIGRDGQMGTHPYPQGYPSTEWEGMQVPPWERPPYTQQTPGPDDIDPYRDLR